MRSIRSRSGDRPTLAVWGPGLAHGFERNLISTLTSSGVETLAPWDDLHRGHGLDIQRGDDLMSLESREEAYDQRVITLGSEAPVPGLDELVQQAATASADEVSNTLLSAPRFQET
jgi:hypothetical protein